jgi:autotransporter-associated beta strand protein
MAAQVRSSGKPRAMVQRIALATIVAGLGLASSAALAQDATWNGTTADWNTPGNWAPSTVPTGTATFSSTGSANVQNTSGVTIGAIQFTGTPNAQAYSFLIGSSFVINGTGVTNASTNPQSFDVLFGNNLGFENGATGNNGSGQVNYTIEEGGSAAFTGTSNAGNASTSYTNHGQITFTDGASAGNATITTSGVGALTSFESAATGGSARLITGPGGIVDISALTTAGMTAGSIEGSGTYELGGRVLTVGSNGLSTTVSGIIADGGGAGGTGGALDKTGAGTLTLTNTNTYTGATTIDGGTLTVNGSIASSSGVAIDSGGTLNGVGAVPAVTVNAGGVLMPGLPNAVGTLTGSGNVTFNSGASYQIFINGTANSKFTTTGNAAINPNVGVGVLGGSSVVLGNRYTILTATGGLTGQFNPTVNDGYFVGTVSEDSNNAYLTFQYQNLAAQLAASLGGLGVPQNPLNVANSLTAALGGAGTLPAGFQSVFNLPPSGASLTNGLEQLDGELGTSPQLGAFLATNQFLGLMLNALSGDFNATVTSLANTGTGSEKISTTNGAPAPPAQWGPFVINVPQVLSPTQGTSNLGQVGNDIAASGLGPLPYAAEQRTVTSDVANAYASALKAPPAPAYGVWQAWGSAYGGTQSLSGAPATVGSHDVTSRVGGFASGLTYRASPDTAYGFALAGAETSWDLAAGFGAGHSDAFQAGVFGTHRMGQAYVSGALAAANYWASTSRVVTVAGADTLQASFDAQSLGGRIEGGYRLNLTPILVTPYAALQAQAFHSPSYGETAASGSPQFALDYAAQTSSAERAEIGSWFGELFLLPNRDRLVLFGRAAYAHDWFTNLAMTPTFQAVPGASFVVNGATPPADLALVTAGAEWRMAHNWSVMARFDGEFGRGDETYTGTAQLRYAW